MIGAEPVIEKRRWLSPVWLLPFIALLLAVGFIYQQFASSGQLIRINFAQGNGILPGKTQLRYQGVAIGVVQDLELAEDGHKIAVLAKIDSRARSLIRKGSDFWLVSPKASLTEISGLDTLVSGNYINLQPGRNNNPLEEEFDALDGPPPGYQAQGRMLHLAGVGRDWRQALFPWYRGGQRHQYPLGPGQPERDPGSGDRAALRTPRQG
ncbi:hypothetical protein CDAIGKPJ_02141 [Aeromonas salmonicida]|nr:putative paraquat-inducible protein B [Aeromonas salmonicida subsp. masoucida NBRC 13784]